jgi:hypothetical protein
MISIFRPLIPKRVRRLGRAIRGSYYTPDEVSRSLAMFVPNSAGDDLSKTSFALDAAERTLPLMIELLGQTTRLIDISEISDVDGDAEELRTYFNSYGSDKSSHHNYHLFYGPLLSPIRNKKLRLLEIGIGTNKSDVVSSMGPHGKPGASLRAFRDFLPHSEIFGADIDSGILFHEDRITTAFVDQTKQWSLNALISTFGKELDIIIDDGLHSPHANLSVLCFALGALKPGGLCIIEDITKEILPVWQIMGTLMPDYNPQLIGAKNGYLFAITKPC